MNRRLIQHRKASVNETSPIHPGWASCQGTRIAIRLSCASSLSELVLSSNSASCLTSPHRAPPLHNKPTTCTHHQLLNCERNNPCCFRGISCSLTRPHRDTSLQ
ncbi:hypothetical protein BJ508DRAFT_20122 [Ascobolus immersus RN42]|uniref:Uncharacterized protein n=1 Tax=Ascobolus immersus RN42 TaxID=1160509 RepID=A0A3N4IFJ3_ASCIM|nr:hypothetical protein BJ508DRAFT_20122 [Ascobolus immersus RN42]